LTPLPTLFAAWQLELTLAARHLSTVTPDSLFRSLPAERGEVMRDGVVVHVQFGGRKTFRVPKQRRPR
jgi:hypothetical protein